MGRLKLFGEQEGGGTADHSALLNLDYATAGHTGFVASEGVPGGQTIKGGTGAGESLQLQSTAAATRGLVRSLDDFRIDGQAALNAAIRSDVILYVMPPGSTLGKAGVLVDVGSESSVGSTVAMGVGGRVATQGSDSYSRCAGLDYWAVHMASTALPTLLGVRARCVVLGSSAGQVTTATGVEIQDPYRLGVPPAPTTIYGLHVLNASGPFAASNVYGICVEDITNGTNRYLAWFGPATPRLRLDAGTPGANQTMLWLAEGTTPTLRRVQWKDGGSIGAGDRVMVLA